MKTLAMSDFHGKVPYGLKKFIKKNEVDLLLSPGDFYGGYHSKKFGKLWKKHIDDIKPNKYGIKNLDGLEKLISKRRLTRLIKDFSNSGVEVLEYLDEINLPVIIVKGNVDNQKSGLTVTTSKYPIEDLVRKFSNIELLEYEAMEFDEYKIVGFGAKFPFLHKGNLRGHKNSIKNNILRLREKERKKLNLLVKPEPERTIILSHNPPENTKLDEIKNPKNPWHGKHVGDDILMRSVKKYQPLLNVCGHMHENQGKIRIGKTLVVNSGYGKKGEFALIDITGNKVKAKLLNLYE